MIVVTVDTRTNKILSKKPVVIKEITVDMDISDDLVYEDGGIKLKSESNEGVARLEYLLSNEPKENKDQWNAEVESLRPKTCVVRKFEENEKVWYKVLDISEFKKGDIKFSSEEKANDFIKRRG